ncbi:MAG: hypothetical protein RL613_1159 [Fusobacteriota bacterium]|jgi:hypothetical protein
MVIEPSKLGASGIPQKAAKLGSNFFAMRNYDDMRILLSSVADTSSLCMWINGVNSAPFIHIFDGEYPVILVNNVELKEFSISLEIIL